MVVSGSLEGRYVYERDIYPQLFYLKRYSSILGQPFITAISSEILISDNLNLNIFISPKDAFNVFKMTSNTKCNANQIIFA